MKLFFIGADRLRCSSLKTWISQSFLKTASIYFHIQVHANKQRDYLVVICSTNARLLTSLMVLTFLLGQKMTKVSPPCDGHIYQAISSCSNVAIFHLSNVFVEPSGYDWLPFSGGQTIVEIYGTLEGFPRCPGIVSVGVIQWPLWFWGSCLAQTVRHHQLSNEKTLVG